MTIDPNPTLEGFPKSASSLRFTLSPSSSSSKFGPRVGELKLSRGSYVTSLSDKGRDGESTIKIETPGLLTSTSRGVVPHISRDLYQHHAQSGPLKLVNVPFETFLEHTPPVPVLYAEHLASSSEDGAASNAGQIQDASKPLHAFLGFKPRDHILALSARDADDTREMPPNGNDLISISTLRGMRKLTPTQYRTYVQTLSPDLAFALHDTPFTAPPYSQKRLTKSIDRSAAWIAKLVGGCRGTEEGKAKGKQAAKLVEGREEPTDVASPTTSTAITPFTTPIIAPLIGSTSPVARGYYAQHLLEPLYGPELDQLNASSVNGKALKTVDEAVAGYSFELAGMKKDLEVISPALESAASTSQLTSLMQASLCHLPHQKPRFVFGTSSPHEILQMVKEVGVDLVDAAWAVKMGGVGVALDFRFPFEGPAEGITAEEGRNREHEQEKEPIGHNLYSTMYVKDFGTLSSSFCGALHRNGEAKEGTCPCLPCSPRAFDGDGQLVRHGADSDSWIARAAPNSSVHRTSSTSSPSVTLSASETAASNEVWPRPPKTTGMRRTLGSSSTAPSYDPPLTRAYLHHLLRTHEMSAHALLVSHNLAVVESFLKGVRRVIISDKEGLTASQTKSSFEKEVETFFEMYALPDSLVQEATEQWKEVDLTRGKGRLGREKEKAKEKEKGEGED